MPKGCLHGAQVRGEVPAAVATQILEGGAYP